MNKTEALASVARIDQLSRGFGTLDEMALQEVRRLLRELELASFSVGSYFREKLHQIEDWASIGFSARKHANYQGGAGQLTVRVVGNCVILRGLIEQHWPTA